MVLKRHRESGDGRAVAGAGGGDEDAASEVGSVGGEEVSREVERRVRDERDRERWAKLKRLKQAFQVRRKGRGKGDAEGNGGEGAGKT